MTVAMYNKSINYFLVAGLLLIIILSVFNVDVVSNMAYIVMFYGAPLLLFLVLYVVTVGYEFYEYLKNKKAHFSLLTIITIKTAVAVSPMFFLDDRLANIMATLNVIS